VGAGTGATVGKWNGFETMMKSGFGLASLQEGELVVGRPRPLSMRWEMWSMPMVLFWAGHVSQTVVGVPNEIRCAVFQTFRP
jgi:hypothetical protein